MKRMLRMLKGNAAVLLAAGVLYLFALACSQSPTAPTVVDETSVKIGAGVHQTTSVGDTFPPPK